MKHEVSYASQLLITAYSQSAVLYSLKDNNTTIGKFYSEAAFTVLTETLSDYMAEIRADENTALKFLSVLFNLLGITDKDYITWINNKWKSAMSVFMVSDRVELDGTFLLNEQEMTLVFASMKGDTLMVDYLNNETGELLSIPLREVDEDTAIYVCKQFEIATGIDCDYRNI